MAYLEFTRTTQTSITVRLADLDLTGQANKGTSRLPRHNSYQVSCLGDVRTLATGSNGYSGTATYAGLTPGTTYQIQGIVNYTDINNNTRTVNIYDECSTDEKPAPARPADWSWWSAVAAGKPVNISADEWKAFYDRIDAFRIYAGQGAWGLYKPVSKGTVISAAIVNEVRAAIGPITTAARPKYINPGDPITADYFNSLKDFLNSVP